MGSDLDFRHGGFRNGEDQTQGVDLRQAHQSLTARSGSCTHKRAGIRIALGHDTGKWSGDVRVGHHGLELRLVGARLALGGLRRNPGGAKCVVP